MLNLVEFTKPELDKLRELCNFSDEELEVFELRAKGVSIVATAQQLNMSESKVSKLIRRIKNKIVKLA